MEMSSLHIHTLPTHSMQVVSTKIEVNRNYLGEKAFQAYQMVASSQVMNVSVVC